MESIYQYMSEEFLSKVKLYGTAVKVGIKNKWQTMYEFYWKLTTGGFRDSPDSWIHCIHNSIIAQTIAIVITVYVIYRWLYLPFFHDYLVAERCHFKLENPEPLKPGEGIIYTISGFLPSTTNTVAQPDSKTQHFFNALTVKVTLDKERIQAMKAYADEDYGKIKVIFTANKSGTYQIDMRYNGFLIPGSPLNITVPPDSMSALNSEVILPAVPVLLTRGMPKAIEIYPKDRTGHPCLADGVRLDKFDFHASAEKPCCNASACGKTLEFIASLWKEGLDASFSYQGSPFGADSKKKAVTVILTLRPNDSTGSYGLFEGQICYDRQIVKNGCFAIVSLPPEEYERLDPILTSPKATDMIQLKAQMIQPISSIKKALEGNENFSLAENANFEKSQPKSFIEWYMFPKGVAEEINDLITKDVYVTISLKYICINEVVWTVLMSRAALFPIHEETKIIVVPETEEREKYLVTISDATQEEVRLLMTASHTRMLMALYLKFRSYALESSENVGEKVNNFHGSLACQNIFC